MGLIIVNTFNYSALIRTFNSEQTLPLTLTSLRLQTNPPSEYIFVDSGSTDNTLQLLPPCSKVHHYIGTEFNYSESLNQGLQYVSTEYVLIISSHTSIRHNSAIEFALGLFASNERIGASYFRPSDSQILTVKLIDKHNFNGYNGLWNASSLIKVPLLRRRGFRPEVFTAEDQEWARWLFHDENMAIACITGAGVLNSNPRQDCLKKRLNENVSIAYFSNPELLSVANLMRTAFTVVKPNLPFALKNRIFYFLLFFRLLACHFFEPKSKSRYF
ncbi:MAG: Glycotrans2-like domain-containing protein [Nitrospira sp.]|nr:MAG: Glycotrans2-like domain-containing protein [Nitrospira sp.]